MDCINVDFNKISDAISKILSNHAEIQKNSKNSKIFLTFTYLGRGIHYPIASEAALKLKELTYIHAEGIPGGELKHGPLA